MKYSEDIRDSSPLMYDLQVGIKSICFSTFSFVRVSYLGRPNAGKSSLMNLLAGYDRAIVSPIPGTTRDTIEEKIRIGDIVLKVTDTAGISDGSERERDIIEKTGIVRARRAMDDAELILFVVVKYCLFDELTGETCDGACEFDNDGYAVCP